MTISNGKSRAKTLTNAEAKLTSSVGNVNITDDTVFYGTINSAQKLWPGDRFSMFLNFSSTRYDLPFTLNISYMKDSVEYQQSIPFTMTFYEDGCLKPIFMVHHVVVDDSQWGDNDGIPESGEEVEFDLYLKNIGNAEAFDVEARISDVSIGRTYEGWKTYNDLSPGSVDKQISSDWNLEYVPSNFAGVVYADITVRCDGNADQFLPYQPLFTISPTAWLLVSPEEFDFGVSPTTVDVRVPVTVENRGTENLVVTGITRSHPDSSWSGDALPWTVSPGVSKVIQVIIETSALQGQRISREVVFQVGPEVHIANDRIVITGLVSDLPPAHQIPEPAQPRFGKRVADVGRNIIVWEDVRNGNTDIYAYDISKGFEFPICTNPADQFKPRISGNLIAWSDRRNWDGQGDPKSDIYAYDMSSGQEFPISTNPWNERVVGIDGHKVAFTRDFHIWTEPTNYGANPANLYCYDFDSNSISAITAYAYSGHNPIHIVDNLECDFGGGILTWKESLLQWNTTYWIIADQGVYKLKVGVDPAPIEIFDRSPDQGPSANDGKVAWAKDEPSPSYDRCVYIWEGGAVKKVTCGDEIASDNLAVGDDLVVYDFTRVQGLFYWDLIANKEGMATNMVDWDCWRMDGHCLVWLSNSKLYYTFLKEADLAVTSADIIFSHDNPLEYETINVNVTVHNMNPWSTTENITVRLYGGDPDADGIQLGTDEVIVGGIVAQRSTTVTFSDVPANAEGTKNIYAKVFVLSGDNPANNKASKLLIVGDTDSQAPIITNVAAQEYNGDGDGRIEDDEQVLISWQAVDTSGVKSSWCTIDSNDFLASGTYYVASGPYALGKHNFTISAMDGDSSPEASEYFGKFTVFCVADVEPDGDVDLADLSILANTWKCSEGQPYYNPTCDLHEDGIIDERDLDLLTDYWLYGK